MLKSRNAKVIVETGTSRKGLIGTKGDGAATIVFEKWAKQNDAKLYSVDISEASVDRSQQAVDEQDLNTHVTIHLGDSLDFTIQV